MVRARSNAWRGVAAGVLLLLLGLIPVQASGRADVRAAAAELLRSICKGEKVGLGEAYRHVLAPNGVLHERISRARKTWILPRNEECRAFVVRAHQDRRRFSLWIEPGRNDKAWQTASVRAPGLLRTEDPFDAVKSVIDRFVRMVPAKELIRYSALPEAVARSQRILDRWLKRFVEPIGIEQASRSDVQRGVKKPQPARWLKAPERLSATTAPEASRLLVLPAGSRVRDATTGSHALLKRPVAGRLDVSREDVLIVDTGAPFHPLQWMFHNPLPDADR